MTTDQLIELLAADLTPVGRRRIMWTMILAVALGAAAAFGAMVLLFNPRLEFPSGRTLDTLLIKIFFASGVAATAAVFLPQLTRPEAQMHSLPARLHSVRCGRGIGDRGSRFVSLVWLGRHDRRAGLVDMSCRDLQCSRSYLSRIIWGPRVGASTDPTRAGEIAGLVAGGLRCIGVRLPLCGWGRFHRSHFGTASRSSSVPSWGSKLGPGLLQW